VESTRLSAAFLIVLPLAAALAAGAVHASPARPFRHLLFSQAPRQVQADLVSYFSKCNVSPSFVRRGALVDVGPFGAPHETDYFFEFNEPYWKMGPFPRSFALACDPGIYRSPTMFWMKRAGGGYRRVDLVDAFIFTGPGQTWVELSHVCKDKDAGDWDCEQLTVWDKRKEAFRPISKVMHDDEAKQWAAARGYHFYRYELEGR